MQIDESDEQPEKADMPMTDSFASAPNVTIERDRHLWKQNASSFLTDPGMQMDESDELSSNALHGIRETVEISAKSTLEMEWHRAKQNKPKS
jgi:hypothetical protein